MIAILDRVVTSTYWFQARAIVFGGLLCLGWIIYEIITEKETQE